MARAARVIAPGMPHHIIQRGNRRQQTFFSDDDYHAYISLMAEWCAKNGVDGQTFVKAGEAISGRGVLLHT